MELIADGVLVLAATVAGLYCLVLSRRLQSLTQMESGVGKAITSMSTQVDEMKQALAEAKSSTERSSQALEEQVRKAKEVASKLERLIDSAGKIEPPKREAEPIAVPAAEAVDDADSSAYGASEDEPEPRRQEPPQKRIDGLISSYLDEFEGEDEATIAHRLVTALTAPGSIKSERAL